MPKLEIDRNAVSSRNAAGIFGIQLAYRAALAALRLISIRGAGERRKLLLFKPDRIGDFLLATGVIHFLCEHIKPSEITLLVSDTVSPLATREFPECDHVVVPLSGSSFRSGLLRGWRAARRANAGRRYLRMGVLRHHRTLFDSVLLNTLDVKTSIATDGSVLGNDESLYMLQQFEPNVGVCYPIRGSSPMAVLELEAHRLLAEKILEQPVKLSDVMPRVHSVRAVDESYLLLLPFGSQPIRTYPLPRLVEAVAISSFDGILKIVLCGELLHKAELRHLADGISRQIATPVEIIHPKGLMPFLELVAGARCVFSMESAGAHFTSALNKRGVFVLGGGHFGYFAPWSRSSRQIWLSKQMDCFGCDWKCSRAAVDCIGDISAESVSSALMKSWHAE